MKRLALQRYLDLGAGKCLLREPYAAETVERLLLDGDLKRYKLLAWVIMPNHVHLVLRVLAPWTLSRIIQDIKRFSASRINKLAGCRGSIWQRDYFDRYIRNEQHLFEAVMYVHNNPVMAGLVDNPNDRYYSSARRVPALDATFHPPFDED